MPPEDHRVSTLMNSDSLTVSIFSAIGLPSVALVAGRKGGMLKTVLTSYRRENNCLFKATVVRMDLVTLNQVKPVSWSKLSLGAVIAGTVTVYID